MAVDKAALDEARAKALEDFIKSTNSKNPGAVFTEFTSPLHVDVISTGALSLDYALGVGGIPRGRVVELYGPEGSGKTSLALSVCANAIAEGSAAAIIDVEHALNFEHVKWMGVDTRFLAVSQPDSAEEALQRAEAMAESGQFSVVVIDSVASLVPKAELEGEIGDQTMALVGRLMSTALRRLVGVAARTNTTMIFINQLREKPGISYGCFNYHSRVILADGSTERIGKIVSQKMDVEVLSYDFDSGKVVPRKVVSWFDNGVHDDFLRVNVSRAGGNGRSSFASTRNHQIRTPEGWVQAKDLRPGDQVLTRATRLFSPGQVEAVHGMLMGDAAISVSKTSTKGRLRFTHSKAQTEYALWKASLLGNIDHTVSRHVAGGPAVDFTPTYEMGDLRRQVYRPSGKKSFSEDYLANLTPLALALWYQDDFGFTVRSLGKQTKSGLVTGRADVVVAAMTESTRKRIVNMLQDRFGIECKYKLVGKDKVPHLLFTAEGTERLHGLIAEFIHPSMQYKLLPHHQGKFQDLAIEQACPEDYLESATVVEVYPMPANRHRHRYDIEVEGSHNYFVDNVLVHNSPEYTPGGRALKFYATVRLDVRSSPSLQIKEGTGASQQVVGQVCKVTVKKNKVSAPFRTAEYRLMYGRGIDSSTAILDVAVATGVWVLRPGGMYFDAESGEQIGRGRDNVAAALAADPEFADRVRDQVMQALRSTAVEEEIDEDHIDPAGTFEEGAAPDPSW